MYLHGDYIIVATRIEFLQRATYPEELSLTPRKSSSDVDLGSPYRESPEVPVATEPNANTQTPEEEAVHWWQQRVTAGALVGSMEQGPTPAALQVLRRRRLIVHPPGNWAFVVRGPSEVEDQDVLRANYWPLVGLVLGRYAPACIDRLSALRLYAGDESIRQTLDIRHRANQSEWRLSVMSGYEILLRPDDDARASTTGPSATQLTVGGVGLSVCSAPPLMLSLTVGEIRRAPELVAIWLKSLIVSRAALHEAYQASPRPVLLRRMAHLADDVGNQRLASTIDDVLLAQSRTVVSRANTGVGSSIILPRYVERSVALSNSGREAWLDRYLANFTHAADQLAERLSYTEAALQPSSANVTLAFARQAKREDTYHSTTIEGYRIQRSDVEAVVSGHATAGRTADEVERLMALTGYSRAFDFVLRQVSAVGGAPMVNEALILDVSVELWSPSIDAGIVAPDDLRKWRTRAVQIAGSDYAPPSADKLSQLMRLVVEQVQATSVGPIARAALLHWAFVHAHPFIDGNGRIARLLMNYLLTHHGHAWTTIRADERATYFHALERAHLRIDLGPFADVVAAATTRAAVDRDAWSRAR